MILVGFSEIIALQHTLSVTMNTNPRESEWWKYFHKGGGYKNDHSHHMAWCRACVHRAAVAIEARQVQEHQDGQQAIVRDYDAIEKRSAYVTISRQLNCNIQGI